MTTLQSLKEQASRIGAIIVCAEECGFREPFEEYLDRDDRVDVEAEEVTFGCPECESDTVDLAKKPEPNTIIVNGLGELEELVGNPNSA